MIYLIGVEHNKTQWEYQDGSNKKFVSFFTDNIRRHIKKLNITVIAEELNQECLEQQNVDKSTAQKIAEEFRIKHVFCEPPALERNRLGILSPVEISLQMFHKELWQIVDNSPEQRLINEEHEKHFSKREQFWFDKIVDLKEQNILFICGKDHTKRFKKLVEGHEFKTTVLSD